jgi:hypothetical protein
MMMITQDVRVPFDRLCIYVFRLFFFFLFEVYGAQKQDIHLGSCRIQQCR